MAEATITKGNESVVVTHGLGFTPDLDKLNVRPKDNLGGRSVWLSDATLTTFQINVSSADTEDHVFSWAYPYPAVGGEMYCTVSQLKSHIQSIKMGEFGFTNESNYDDWLETLLIRASRFIDSYCERPDNFFIAGGVSQTQYFSGSGVTPPAGMYEFSESAEDWEQKAGTLFLSQRPVLSITSVHENKADIGEADDWQLITAYRWLEHGEVVFAIDAIPAAGIKNIRVVYIIGFSGTPRNVEMACCTLVVNLLHKELSDKMQGFTSFTRPTALNFGSPQVFTADIKTILDRYKLASFGEM